MVNLLLTFFGIRFYDFVKIIFNLFRIKWGVFIFNDGFLRKSNLIYIYIIAMEHYIGLKHHLKSTRTSGLWEASRIYNSYSNIVCRKFFS